ncbi:hypothetical protein GCM10022405_12190 [Gibbsiella dentisursi]|uniref:Uncharacterized protein n=1 Tax=Gibbsiella dentisursi TaxID=796890 RepID=A0ABP7KXC9_9GAMM
MPAIPAIAPAAGQDNGPDRRSRYADQIQRRIDVLRQQFAGAVALLPGIVQRHIGISA